MWGIKRALLTEHESLFIGCRNLLIEYGALVTECRALLIDIGLFSYIFLRPVKRDLHSVKRARHSRNASCFYVYEERALLLQKRRISYNVMLSCSNTGLLPQHAGLF